MAGHVSAFSLIAFGMVDHKEYLQSHADALAEGGKQLNLLFPEGSGGEDTHALPAIWEESEKFGAAVVEAEKATAELRVAAAGGDRKAIVAAFKAVGKSCKGCHENYREEHDH
jgi:cytochrome c556